MKVKSESEVAQSCPTLSDPMDCSLPVLGIFQARVLEWVAIAFSVCHAKELEICFIGGHIQLEFYLGNDNSGVIVHVAMMKGKIF